MEHRPVDEGLETGQLELLDLHATLRVAPHQPRARVTARAVTDALTPVPPLGRSGQAN